MLTIILTSNSVLAAPSACNSNGYVYDSLAFCNSNCSGDCLELISKPGSLVCSPDYQNFIYAPDKHRTFAISQSSGFWTQWTNQVIIDSEQTNDLASSILSYSSISNAWIGLKDFNQSQYFNSVNPDRFKLSNSNTAVYRNWSLGQPDNELRSQDVGSLPSFGEHWGYMNDSGKWFDGGYHANGNHNLNVLAEWNGALNCVSGTPDNDYSDTGDISNSYCTDDINDCKLCVHGNNYNDISQCKPAVNLGGNLEYSCPVGETSCSQNLTNPTCRYGGTLNTNRDKCQLDPICPTGWTYNNSLNKCTKSAVCPSGFYNNGSYGCRKRTGIYVVDETRNYSSTSCKGSCSNYRCPSNISGWYIKSKTAVGVGIYYIPVYTTTKPLAKISVSIPSGYSYMSKCGTPSMTVNQVCEVDGVKGSCFIHNSGTSSGIQSTEYFPTGTNVYIKVTVTSGRILSLHGTLKVRTYDYHDRYCPTGTESPISTCSLDSTCRTGYTFTNINPDKCESSPVCSAGQYDNGLNKCFNGYSCPLGNQYSCNDISSQNTSGTNFVCSPYICQDAGDSGNINNTDNSTEGEGDIHNDGEIDEDGNCLGTIYFFTGRDRRCRPSGTQTSFSDCCSKDEYLFGTMECNPQEQELATLRDWGTLGGKCHEIGDYCAEKWGTCPACTCVQKKKTYCCFGDPLARIFQVQGRPQLGISWGSPEDPNCRGFTAAEFQRIDFSMIDFSEWIDEMSAGLESDIQQGVNQNINNMTESMQNMMSN